MIFLLAFFISILSVNVSGWTTTERSQFYIQQWKNIIGYDTLIDIHSRHNKSDKNIWYFKSPLIQNQPKLMSFKLRALMGNFNKLNDRIEPVKIGGHVFPHIKFNGSATLYYVQFIPHLWNPPLNISNPFHIEILGDWTQGNETIMLSDVTFY